MTKLRSSLILCGTICAVIALALVISAVTYGSSIQLLSHGPTPIPTDDGNGGNIISHGPTPIPTDDGNGGNIISHGPTPIPTDDGNGGNLRLV